MNTLRILSILLSLVVTVTAAAQTRVSAADGSRLWIEGTSTINEFKCAAGQIDGEATLERGHAIAEVVIPVHTFDCGKSRMNRDFYEALKADNHPRIHFELVDANREAGSGSEFDVTVNGRLTIGGVTRNVTLVSEARKHRDGHYRVLGRLPLSMRDFDIEPPSAFAGLIRAHDRIVVAFDILARIEAASTAERCAAASGIHC